nr:hypothetical protein [Tanacetum cinerariifolium]
ANAPPKVLRKDYVASHPPQSTLEGVSDPDSLSYAKPRPAPDQDVAQKAVVTKDSDSKKSTSFTSMVGSPGSIYQPWWGVTNNCRLDTPTACQDMVDHIVPPGYFSELRHLPNDEFLNQYNTTLARQMAMGSQLRLRFEQETKLLKKPALLEAEVDIKEAAEAKNVELAKELESLRVQFSDLQVRNNQLSQEVSTLQAQVIGEERIKAAFDEFKKYDDDRCAESIELRQVFADVVSVEIAKGMSEGLKHGVEHEKAKVDLVAIEAYDAELKISVYPEVCSPKDPWSFKDEILLEDAIAAN